MELSSQVLAFMALRTPPGGEHSGHLGESDVFLASPFHSAKPQFLVNYAAVVLLFKRSFAATDMVRNENMGSVCGRIWTRCTVSMLSYFDDAHLTIE